MKASPKKIVNTELLYLKFRVKKLLREPGGGGARL